MKSKNSELPGTEDVSHDEICATVDELRSKLDAEASTYHFLSAYESIAAPDTPQTTLG
jgi:hypothetical protein